MTTAAATGVSRWRFPGWRTLALAAAVGVAMGVIGTAIVLLHISTPRAGRPDGIGVVGFMFLAILVAPLEEWLFRGVILQRLIKPLGATAALLLSAAVFAFAHQWGFPAWVFRFVGGLVLGAFYLRTGLLWPPAVLHCAYNITWFTAMYLFTPT